MTAEIAISPGVSCHQMSSDVIRTSGMNGGHRHICLECYLCGRDTW